MRIAHVFHHYPPALGGMENVVQNLAERQAELGHDVQVVTSVFGARDRPKKETVNGVCIHRLAAIRFHYSDLTYPTQDAKEILGGCDAVHVHSQNSLFNIVLLKRARGLKKPAVMDFVAVGYLESHANPLTRFFGSCYQKLIQDVALDLVDKAITTNKMDHMILRDEYGLQSDIVPHGVGESFLKRPRDDTIFREKYRVDSENVVTYIGRLDSSKGVDVLIRSLPYIASVVDDFVVVIAGSGPSSYREGLRELARDLGLMDRVMFPGFISENEKISLLDSSKVFVFPTRHLGENYGLAIDEAYARGVPVVAAEVGVTPYRVKDMETGILVPPNAPSSLAKAVVALLSNSDLLARMREGVRSAKGSLLTWSQVCEIMNSIYHGIVMH